MSLHVPRALCLALSNRRPQSSPCRPASPHRQAIGSCITEVFALPRPELDLPSWCEFKACAETDRPLRALGGFQLTAEHGMDEFTAADTLIVTAVPDVRGTSRSPTWPA